MSVHRFLDHEVVHGKPGSDGYLQYILHCVQDWIAPGKIHGDNSLVTAWPKAAPGLPWHFALCAGTLYYFARGPGKTNKACPALSVTLYAKAWLARMDMACDAVKAANSGSDIWGRHQGMSLLADADTCRINE